MQMPLAQPLPLREGKSGENRGFGLWTARQKIHALLQGREIVHHFDPATLTFCERGLRNHKVFVS